MTDPSTSLSDAYRRYKDGTNRVITWLAIAAQKSSNDSTKKPSRPKKKPGAGKHKTSSRAAKNPKIIALLSNLVPFATDVASQDVEVPVSIIEILRQVICVRKECALWYRNRTSSDQGANEGHQHFINILQTIYDLLEPRKATRTCSKQESTTKKHTKNAGPANIFEHLELEEIGDSEADTESPQTTDKVKPSVVVPDLKHEMETADEERLFALFCFFQTMFTVRGFLLRKWSDQASTRSSHDLGSLSLTTNAAMNMIRRVEEDMIAIFPEFGDHAKVLEFLEGSGIDVKSGDASQTARSAAGEIKVAPNQLFYHDIWDVLNFACTASAEDLMYYCAMDVPDGISEFDRAAAQLDQTRQNFHNEYTSLAYLHDKIPLCSNYQLGQGFAIMRLKKKVPTWVVFSFELVLGLQVVFSRCDEDISASYEHLRTFCDEASTTLSQYTEFAKTYTDPEIASLKSWNRGLKRPIQLWIEKAKLICDEDMVGSVTRIRSKGEGDDVGENYLFKHDPVLTGLILMDFKVIMHIMGLGLGSAGNIIISCAHLYNAARQYGLLDRSWVDMEDMIAFQSEQHIFVGGRPKEPFEIMNHSLLAMGVSTTAFANQGRGIFDADRLPMNAQRMGRKLETTSPYLKLSYERRRRVLRPTAAVDDIAKLFEGVIACQRKKFSSQELSSISSDNADEAVSYSDPFGVAKEVFGGKQKSCALEPVQMLDVFLESLEAGSPHLNYNYFSLFQNCLQTMRTVRDLIIHGADPTFCWPDAELQGDRGLTSLATAVLRAALLPNGLFSLKEASDAILSEIFERGDVQHQQQKKNDAARGGGNSQRC
ncbi:hypothetical protein BDV97DRAFT_76959 [Delphinella strobiligena]|nr:hypothetical protein BDV97DRAFT_76959 [Delphinella strobiligena]